MSERGAPCHGPGDAWCGEKPAQLCELDHLTADDLDSWRAWLDRYSYVCPDRDVLEKLIAWGPIVELGAGRGYWARLLRDLGGDVVAYDNESWSYTGVRWTEVERADESAIAEHADRTLLIVKPPRPGSGRMIRAWPGVRLVVVTDGPFPNPKMGFEGEQDAVDAIGEAWSLDSTHALPDPVIRWFVGARFFRRRDTHT